MIKPVSTSSESTIDLANKSRIDIFVRLANTQKNWTSSFDKEIAKTFPKLQSIENGVKCLGDYDTVRTSVDNLYFIGTKFVTLVNAYVYTNKDSRGRYIFDESAFYKIIEELDKNNPEKIISIDLRFEQTVDKQIIINKLNKILKFSKAIISI